MKLLKTTETATVNNYPYGRLQCVKTWQLEHKPGKGFRAIGQTTNPKTGRLNAPKKSVYYPVAWLSDNDGFIKIHALHLNGAEEINRGVKFLSENFNLFTIEQVKDIFAHIIIQLRVELQAICQYCGAQPEKVKPLILPLYEIALHGYKTGENVFSQIQIDIEKLNACKVPNFQPFRVVEYRDMLTNGLNNPIVTKTSDHDKRNGETILTIQAEESAKAVIREVLK